LLVEALDVECVDRQSDRVMVGLELRERQIDQT
jgi:hypothetical protein